jgi:hypothetical protein
MWEANISENTTEFENIPLKPHSEYFWIADPSRTFVVRGITIFITAGRTGMWFWNLHMARIVGEICFPVTRPRESEKELAGLPTDHGNAMRPRGHS